MVKPAEEKGLVMQIELGRHRPSRKEVEEKIATLAARLRPNVELAGIFFEEDKVFVAFVPAERYHAAQREGPEALKRLTPWGNEETAHLFMGGA